jgi:hypothetical protein
MIYLLLTFFLPNFAEFLKCDLYSVSNMEKYNGHYLIHSAPLNFEGSISRGRTVVINLSFLMAIYKIFSGAVSDLVLLFTSPVS